MRHTCTTRAFRLAMHNMVPRFKAFNRHATRFIFRNKTELKLAFRYVWFSELQDRFPATFHNVVADMKPLLTAKEVNWIDLVADNHVVYAEGATS